MVNGQRLTFEVWGLDRQVLIMQDRETGTIWAHLDGTATRGELEGTRLTMVPLPMMTWSEWKRAYPHTLVLSPEAGHSDPFGSARLGVPNQREAEYGDDRLPSNALVVGVEEDGVFMAYPLEDVQAVGGVVNGVVNDKPVVVLHDGDARTGIAYSRVASDTTMEFYNADPEGFELRDYDTNTLWDAQGRAVEGLLAGTELAGY